MRGNKVTVDAHVHARMYSRIVLTGSRPGLSRAIIAGGFDAEIKRCRKRGGLQENASRIVTLMKRAALSKHAEILIRQRRRSGIKPTDGEQTSDPERTRRDVQPPESSDFNHQKPQNSYIYK